MFKLSLIWQVAAHHTGFCVSLTHPHCSLSFFLVCFLGSCVCVCVCGWEACRILVPWPEIEPVPSAKKAWNPLALESENESVSCSAVSDSLQPMGCSSPGSFIHRVFQAGVLEWVAMPFSRGSSWPRNWIRVSCITGRFFTIWVTREAWWTLVLRHSHPLPASLQLPEVLYDLLVPGLFISMAWRNRTVVLLKNWWVIE